MQNKNLKVWILLFMLIFFKLFGLSAQDPQPPTSGVGDPLFANPSISSFGDKSMLSVGLYTGTPNISFSLVNVSYKDLTIPISLNYTSGRGVKPDVFPGIVGNGWEISLGGEIEKVENSLSTAQYFEATGLPLPVDINYLSDEDWSSPSKMEKLIKQMTTIVSTENVNDIYRFSFLGKSGIIYKDESGDFKIKTSEGEVLKIIGGSEVSYIPNMIPFEEQDTTLQGVYSMMSGGPDPGNFIFISNFIYDFVIIDSKGISYQFGGTLNSIDFVRPGLLPTEFDTGQRLTAAKKWYLTKIVYPNGDSILFNYERRKFFVTSQIGQKYRLYYYGNVQVPDYTNPQPYLSISSTLTNPCYLDEIITPIQKIKFKWSESDKQLQYKFNIPNGPDANNIGDIILNESKHLNHLVSSIYFSHYPSIWNASMKNRSPDKLDSISVYDYLGNKHQTVTLGYTDDTTTRLKLIRVDSYGRTLADSFHYEFSYNSKKLPKYLEMKTDHFGYYNGRSVLPYYYPVSDPGNYISFFSDPLNRQLYYESREPNPDSSDAEILEKITLPTGGFIKYIYEPNTYGGYTTNWPNTFVQESESKLTCGLRVKSIERYSSNEKLTESKRYFYNKNHSGGGEISSGVLSHMPVYYEEFTGIVKDTMRIMQIYQYNDNALFKHWNTNSINPMDYYHGDYLTYSEVTEEDGISGGSSSYKYSNYDNGYLNRPVENQIMDDRQVSEVWKNDEENNMELERGKLLEKIIYDNLKRKISRTIYQYNEDPNRFMTHGRSMILRSNPNYSIYTPSVRYVAKLIYNYYHYLESITQIMYKTPIDSLITKQFFNYNSQNLLLSERTLNSLGNSIIKKYSYPIDSSGKAVYDSMLAQNKISVVLNETQYVNSNIVKKINTSYKTFANKIHMPENTSYSTYNNSSAIVVRYNQYDNKGNLLEIQKGDNFKEVFLWGYKGQFPVAHIVGADWANIKTSVDTSILNNGTESQKAEQLASLREKYAGSPSIQITTYTYEPLVGIKSETAPNGMKTTYEYDNFNRLHLVKDNDGNIIRRICYNYDGQPEGCGQFMNAPEKVFAKLTYENQNYTSSAITADIVVRFFLDDACTIPYSVTNMIVNYLPISMCADLPLPPIQDGGLPFIAQGNYAVLETQAIITTYSSDNCELVYFPPLCPECPGEWLEVCDTKICQIDFQLMPGEQYIIK